MINNLNNENISTVKNVTSEFTGIGNCPDFFLKRNNQGKTFDLPLISRQNISSNYILAALSDFDAVRLEPHLDFVFLKSGEEIYPVGGDSRYVYFPETSVVSDIYDLADGGTIETAMIGNEGAAGLNAILGSISPNHRARTTIGGSAWRIKTEILKQEFARPGILQTQILDFINNHINQISQRFICKSFHILEQRLCSWMLMLHDRVKNNRLMLTQEMTALLLGAHRPSITLAAQILRGKGLINYSRGEISILNRTGLETSACECYTVLRKNSQMIM